MSKVHCAVSATVYFLLLGYANVARAQTVVVPTATDSENIYVGALTVSGVGYRNVVCYDDPDGSNDEHFVVGDEDGLTEHTDVYGYPSGGVGTTLGDVIRVFRFGSSTALGYCNTGGGAWSSGTWDPPMMSGESMTLFGASGRDIIYGGGGFNEFFVLGQDGNDDVYMYAVDGAAYGGAGNDNVLGYSASFYDYLYGQSGLDCLYDSTDSAGVFNCGSTTSGDRRDTFNQYIGYTQCNFSHENCW